MKDEAENNLKLFQFEAKKILEKEYSYMKRNTKYKYCDNVVKKTEAFMKTNNLLAVSSDKTNRIVVTDKLSFIQRVENVLSDTNIYKPLPKSKCNAIEKQANTLIRSTCKNKPNIDSKRLISCGSKPAKFYCTIKDHKDKNDGNFPLRPIASSIGTPTEKVDWLLSKILNNLVPKVISSIKSTDELIEYLRNISLPRKNNLTFISLDVKNLYTSIPLLHGIETVIKFVKEHENTFDSYGFSHSEIEKFLKFITFNNEVYYNNKTYLQIQGCPMGSHYAPAFAIIYMNHIENMALNKLSSSHNIQPCLYKRYIDDIIMGPFPNEPSILNSILDIFNSVSANIKFSIDVPMNNVLNFLDISISIANNQIKYELYRKDCHSGNTLHYDSWVPSHVKTNFIKNSYTYVEKRCSTHESVRKNKNKMTKRLRRNGFNQSYSKHTSSDNTTKIGNKNKNKNSVNLKLDYINDSTNRKLNRLADKYDLPINLVSKPGRQISSCFNYRNNLHNCNCNLCGIIGKPNICNLNYVVYKFICKHCGKNYIGSTNRTLSARYSEHKCSLHNQDSKSALSEHAKKDHYWSILTIDDFDIIIMQCLYDPVSTRIAEAKLISIHQPCINRKQELTSGHSYL